jgi:hypothetical protein
MEEEWLAGPCNSHFFSLVAILDIFFVGFFSSHFDSFVLNLVFKLDIDLVSSSSNLLVSAGFSVSHHFCADQPLSLECQSVSTITCFSAAASGGVFSFFFFFFLS